MTPPAADEAMAYVDLIVPVEPTGPQTVADAPAGAASAIMDVKSRAPLRIDFFIAVTLLELPGEYRDGLDDRSVRFPEEGVRTVTACGLLCSSIESCRADHRATTG
jgi:hypothetical protein